MIEREEVLRILKLMREEWDVNSKCPNAQALDMAIESLGSFYINRNTIDYEQEIKNIKDKHIEEVTYLKEKIDEMQKQLAIYELKWSVVEMIFNK